MSGLAGLAGLAFLAASVCADAGARDPALFFTGTCERTRLQETDDHVRYRRHDRPNIGASTHHPRGYQASDSALWRRDGEPLVVQTFDFGDAARAFARFDAGEGDGGQVLARVGTAYHAVFTEDGGGGRQWFVGPGCRQDTRQNGKHDREHHGGRRGLASWLLFGDDIVEGAWTQHVATLNIVHDPAACPAHFNRALTRYRLDRRTLPLRVTRREGARAVEIPFETEVVVSEHFGRGSVATADHLERFTFARGLGMVRWERWEELDRTLLPDAAARADAFASTGRCPERPLSGPPGPRWRQVDCREWLSFFPVEDPPFSVSELGFGPRFEED